MLFLVVSTSEYITTQDWIWGWLCQKLQKTKPREKVGNCTETEVDNAFPFGRQDCARSGKKTVKYEHRKLYKVEEAQRLKLIPSRSFEQSSFFFFFFFFFLEKKEPDKEAWSLIMKLTCSFPSPQASQLVSWYFEPSQPQRITSGLKAMFSLFVIYSARKSPNYPKTTKSVPTQMYRRHTQTSNSDGAEPALLSALSCSLQDWFWRWLCHKLQKDKP